MSETVTFKYRRGATTYSRTFNVLALRGLTEPDAYELWPPLQWRMVDGRIQDDVRGFRRIITATLGVQQEYADRIFILNFLQSPDRWIYLGTLASVYCVLADVTAFENRWLQDTSLLRYFDIELREEVTYTVWPEWVEPTADALMYIGSDWIEVTGDESNPITLTTNAGVLAVDATGNPYPAINLAAYAVELFIRERGPQSTPCMAGNVTQSGSDITFQVWHGDAGNPYTDGKFWCKITIGLQAK